MGEILITFIKQSSAYKLMKISRQMKIYAKVVQTPKELSQGGCSYAVLARRTDARRILGICSDYKIEYRRIFSIYSDINGKKVYSDM